MNTTQPSAGAVKLLPCPFCACDKITVEWEPRRWFAECTQCSCQGPFCQKEPEVPAKWNQRAHVAPLIEALGELILIAPRDSKSNAIALKGHTALQQWKDGKG